MTSSLSLRFPEEVLLLALDDDTGHLRPLPRASFVNALAGAMLFELAFLNIIDNDTRHVHVVATDPGEIPEDLLDLYHALASQPTPPTLEEALAVAAICVPGGLPSLYEGLLAKGILKRKGSGLRMASAAVYVKSDWEPVRAAREKVRRALDDKELPDPREVVLVSLLEACGLAEPLFGREVWEAARERVEQLIRMECIGQTLLRVIREADPATYESTTAGMLGISGRAPDTSAGGLPAVLSAMSHVYRELGARRGALALSRINQPGGFDCTSCAWPESLTECSRFDFCENGAKALASEATSRTIGADFFAAWRVDDLAGQSDVWMEQQGRLTQPVILREGSSHYEPATYEEAYRFIADKLSMLKQPDEAVFYACGHSSNEASFLFQLLARQFGTNNLPSSINLCHEPSGKALTQALGHGKGDARLEDIEQADALFLFGHNPGSNHPRMLKSLQKAVRRGAVIVAINPLPEAGLTAFANPQEAGGLLGISTPLAQRHLPIRSGGDMALLQGMAKQVLEEEARHPGTILDRAFIEKHTDGFDAYAAHIRETDWAAIEATCGISRDVIQQAASIYLGAQRAVATWGLGITQQHNGTETIREIINLMMLRGHIGRDGAGLCPMRGHSNILGMRSMGAGEHMPPAFLDALERETGLATIPRAPGLHAVDAIRAMQDGRVRALISLGGNLAASAPDTAATTAALKGCDLTVLISTKLNRTHAAHGKNAVILPCLGRTERDVVNGNEQTVWVEDMMGCVHASRGPLAPAHTDLRGETRLLAELGQLLFGDDSPVPWSTFASDYATVRQLIARVVPSYREAFASDAKKPARIALHNPIRARDFSGTGGKAHFAVHPLPCAANDATEHFRLMTIRSHDQFNTTIYGLDDRYRGIRHERRVALLNRDDMQSLGLAPEQAIRLTSHSRGETRTAPPFYAIPYAIPPGCVAAYFPEANALTFLDELDTTTGTPASKSVRVTITPA
ncbi:MAG: hypothetical protein EOM20_06000 [Spartobacteria bacterium]|nr:hypothetical protein [Spartobacteria bacterium]